MLGQGNALQQRPPYARTRAALAINLSLSPEFGEKNPNSCLPSNFESRLYIVVQMEPAWRIQVGCSYVTIFSPALLGASFTVSYPSSQEISLMEFFLSGL